MKFLLYRLNKFQIFVYLRNIIERVLLMPGLDINWFRADKGYDPNVIRKSLEKRFRDTKLLDDIIEKDN